MGLNGYHWVNGILLPFTLLLKFGMIVSKVAFSLLFPGKEDTAHQKDEHIEIKI
jgi:acetylornithine deacetylase/succinyl-diaminopimelate desuccinylase-like protein